MYTEEYQALNDKYMEDSVQAQTSFDVDAFLDNRRFGAIHLRILLILSLVMLADGYDIFIAGMILPELARSWQIEPQALTGIFVCQQAGLLTGVLITGPLADAFGRKRILLICVACFGFTTFLVSLAASPVELMALRFISAIFFSGVLPSCVAMISEIAPGRLRASLIGIVFCGYSGGQFVCAAVLAYVIGPFGWQGAFYVGALLPLVLLPLVLFGLPESPRYLTRRNPADPRIPVMLKSFDPQLSLSGDEVFTVADIQEKRKVPLSKLFGGSFLVITVLIWSAYFFAFTANQMMSSWDTTILRNLADIPYDHIALMISTQTALGIVGMASAGFLMDRFGATRMLSLFFALGATMIVGLAFSDLGSTTGLIFYALTGYAMNSALSGLNALAATSYPSTVRVTAVAWGSGFGRMGGMLGPVVGGLLLAQKPSTTIMYLSTALPEILCALAIFILALVLRARKRAAQSTAG